MEIFSSPAYSKHAFIVTTAGKPVWSLVGSADSLASLAPIVQAVLARAEDHGEPLAQMSLADGSVLLVCSRGPLHCCLLSRGGEGCHSLGQQLRLLHSYLLFATLPSGSIPAALERAPGLDVRPQCAGAGGGMSAALALAALQPSVWADAYPLAQPLAAGLRPRLAAALGSGGRHLSAAASSQLLYALLLTPQGCLVAWAQQREVPLRPSDLHCLAAYLRAGSHGCSGAQDVWVPAGLPGVSTEGTVQLLLRQLGEGATPRTLLVQQSPLEDPAAAAAAAAQLDPPPPALYLALVLVGDGAEAAVRRASAIERALLELAPLPALLEQPTFEQVMEPLHSALGLAWPPGSSSGSGSGSGLTLLHFGYLWKPARQWAGCGVWPPEYAAAGGRREAVVAAFGEVFEQACAPQARHTVAAFQWGGTACTLAALNASNSVLIGLWGEGEGEGEGGGAGEGEASGGGAPATHMHTELVPGLMERLAKVLGKAPLHDRMLLLPGPAKI